MDLYIFRHGHTVWNGEHRFQGRTDIPLDEKGLEQVTRLARRVQPLQFAHLYSSPLIRAQETARIIASMKKLPPIEIWEDLTETDFGVWEGLEVSAVERDYPELFRVLWTDPKACNPQGKETLENMVERADRVLERTRRAFAHGNVGITSHGYFSGVLMTRALGLPWDQLRHMLVYNATLSVLHWDGEKWTLSLKGDRTHLEGL